MATTSTNALDSLLYINNGYPTARWNYTDAVGTQRSAPGGIGNAVSLTYSFLASNPFDSGENGFRAFTALEQSAAQEALALIASVANITFNKVASQLGQITFGMSAQNGSSAYAYIPTYSTTTDSSDTITSVSEDAFGGNVWVNANETWTAADWQPGGWGRLVLLHEVGHALGLKHPFEPGRGNTGYVLAKALDNHAHTVMSYTPGPHTALVELSGTQANYTWSETNLYASTLMPMDIQALQALYGANTSWEAGRTVYRWTTNEEMLETIWDGGGVDTINCANQVYTCEIDLREGAYSSIGLRTTLAEIRAGLDLPAWLPNANLPDDIYNGEHNVAIALGAVIENATGGKGDDVITGNAAKNRLAGGAGADKLVGGAGKDILTGGAGTDTMTGGAGRDVFDFNRAADSSAKLAKADVISGFVSGMDRIDLSDIDANTAAAGQQDFTFIGADAFGSDATGQVRFEGGVLYASTDADAAAELVIKMPGVRELVEGDLIL